MTKRLDEAIEKIRALPDVEQDEAAEMLLDIVSRRHDEGELDAQTLSAIREGLEQAERGEFVSEEEMEAFFKQRGA